MLLIFRFHRCHVWDHLFSTSVWCHRCRNLWSRVAASYSRVVKVYKQRHIHKGSHSATPRKHVSRVKRAKLTVAEISRRPNWMCVKQWACEKFTFYMHTRHNKEFFCLFKHECLCALVCESWCQCYRLVRLDTWISAIARFTERVSQSINLYHIYIACGYWIEDYPNIRFPCEQHTEWAQLVCDGYQNSEFWTMIGAIRLIYLVWYLVGYMWFDSERIHHRSASRHYLHHGMISSSVSSATIATIPNDRNDRNIGFSVRKQA